MHARAQDTDSPPLIRYGFPELVSGTSPAAGADFSQAIGGQSFVRLVSLFVRLVTDGTVANREVVLEYLTAEGNRYALAGAPVTVAASSTYDYAFNTFQPTAEWPCDSTILVPLLPMVLRPTDSFKLHVVNVAAGDQLSRIRWVQERFYSSSPVPG